MFWFHRRDEKHQTIRNSIFILSLPDRHTIYPAILMNTNPDTETFTSYFLCSPIGQISLSLCLLSSSLMWESWTPLLKSSLYCICFVLFCFLNWDTSSLCYPDGPQPHCNLPIPASTLLVFQALDSVPIAEPVSSCVYEQLCLYSSDCLKGYSMPLVSLLAVSSRSTKHWPSSYHTNIKSLWVIVTEY